MSTQLSPVFPVIHYNSSPLLLLKCTTIFYVVLQLKLLTAVVMNSKLLLKNIKYGTLKEELYSERERESSKSVNMAVIRILGRNF